MTQMSATKIVVYALLIISIIFGLLLSMLHLEKPQEFIIAKWAICGILSVIVMGISLLDLRFFSKHTRITFSLTLKVIVIPMLVFVFAAAIFSLIGSDDLSEKIFLQAPLLPVYLVFVVSIATHAAYLYLHAKQRGHGTTGSEQRGQIPS